MTSFYISLLGLCVVACSTPVTKKAPTLVNSTPQISPATVRQAFEFPAIQKKDWLPFFQITPSTQPPQPSASPNSSLTRINQLLYEGNIKAATPLLEDFLHHHPHHTEGLFALARIKLLSGEFEQCMNILNANEKRLADTPLTPSIQRIRIHYMRARALFEAGRWEDSMRLAQNILLKHDDFLPSYSLIAGILIHKGYQAQAEFVLDRALDISGESPGADLLNLKGVHAYSREDYLKAIEWFEKALIANKHYLPSQINLANSYLALGDHAQAKKMYSNILAKTPDQAIAWLGLAVAVQHEGESKDIERYLQAAIQNGPYLASAKLNQSLYLLSHGANKVNALPYLKEAQHARKASERVKVTAGLLFEIIHKPTTHLPATHLITH
ncbi:MAG: tetratricopeptide repeat protein [Zetaproteobacteria bacterium]|nr:tetratricopeptide repeat protein [Zetaproteobacteria bacterium]